LLHQRHVQASNGVVPVPFVVLVWIFFQTPFEVGLRRERSNNTKETVFPCIGTSMRKCEEPFVGLVH
jgi:hypothetical protein